MWVIASIPFWLIGILFFLASFCSVNWRQRPTTNEEILGLLSGLAIAGVFFLVAAKVAS